MTKPQIDLNKVKDALAGLANSPAAETAKRSLKKGIPFGASLVAATATGVAKVARSLSRPEGDREVNLNDLVGRARDFAQRSEVKKTAQSALIRSLRSVESLCAAGAEKLGDGAPEIAEKSGGRPRAVSTAKAAPAKAEEEESMRPTSSRDDRAEPPRSAGSTTYRKPQRRGSREREVIQSADTYHRGRGWLPIVSVMLACFALGALAFGTYTWFSRSSGTTTQENPVIVLPDLPAAPHVVQRPVIDQPTNNAEMMRLTRSGVNLRSDHGTKGTRILAKLDRQDVTVLDRWSARGAAYPWYRVETVQGTGWVYGRYLEPARPQQPTPVITSGGTPGRIKGVRVNIRDDHSTRNTRVLTRLSDTPVTILDSWRANGDPWPWYKIRLEDGEGWVYGQYVSVGN